MLFQQKCSSEHQKPYKTNGFSTKNEGRKAKNLIKPIVFQQKWPSENQKHYKTNGFSTKTVVGKPKTL